jgi:hypothetical protein
MYCLLLSLFVDFIQFTLTLAVVGRTKVHMDENIHHWTPAFGGESYLQLTVRDFHHKFHVEILIFSLNSETP